MFKEPLCPFPQTSLYAFSWTTLPLSERTYFMDDPKVIHNKETSKTHMKAFLVGFLKKLPRCVFRKQTKM